MKIKIILWLILFCAVLTVPLTVIFEQDSPLISPTGSSHVPAEVYSSTPSSGLQGDTEHNTIQATLFEGVPDTFLIYNESTERVESVSSEDFVRGAIAAEMPAMYHIEALKAQGVAAYTFAVRQALTQKETPDPNLEGADFYADPENLKVYLTRDEAVEFYGEDFDLYWNKVNQAAQEVMGYILLYESEPAATAYHAISAGKTESAANIWQYGEALPYLQPVDSSWDVLSAGYETTAIFTPVQLQELVSSQRPHAVLPTDASQWISVSERSDSGYVTSVQVGDEVFTGLELRDLLGLRSSHFEVNYNGNFIFTVCGYGHGAGLSQNGADYMARQGSTFDEILLHYYPDTTLGMASE